jgi:hypothetical protein
VAARLAALDLREGTPEGLIESARLALVCLGPDAVTELETVLRSPIRAEREHAAGCLLRSQGREDWTYTPSDPFLDVLVASLGDEANARLARAEVLWYLRGSPARVQERLALLLDGGNLLARFGAAVLLAPVGSEAPTALRAAAAGVLVEHLRDNDIREDAVLATSALVEAGAAARPVLEVAAAGEDVQQRRLAALILRRIVEPEADAARLTSDDPARITATMRDPTLRSVHEAIWR